MLERCWLTGRQFSQPPCHNSEMKLSIHVGEVLVDWLRSSHTLNKVKQKCFALTCKRSSNFKANQGIRYVEIKGSKRLAKPLNPLIYKGKNFISSRQYSDTFLKLLYRPCKSHAHSNICGTIGRIHKEVGLVLT